MSSDFQVWRVLYHSDWEGIAQEVSEWLVVTPTGVAKFKHCKWLASGRSKLFIDVQAQGKMLDVGAIKRHPLFRQMARHAKNNPVLYGIDSITEFFKGSGLEQEIGATEKGRNAVMMLMGHDEPLLTNEQVIEIKQEKAAVKQREAVAKARVDEMWGIF